MSYSALRKGRFSEENKIYCVTTVTHQRKPLFANLSCARIVINEMKHLDYSNYVASISWVVMPDHLHWMFQLSDKYKLNEVIKRLKAVSARLINQELKTSGSVWQRSYYDRCIRQDEDFKQIARYIIANPLRAGLVKYIGDYPHWDAKWL